MISSAAPMQRKLARWTAAACAGALAMHASAGIFDDEEARRAILDLRQKVETMRRDTDQKLAEEARRQTEEVAALRRSLLDLQNQLESSLSELAKVRGQNEQLARDLSEAQRRVTEANKALDERLRKFEPSKISYEGAEFALAYVDIDPHFRVIYDRSCMFWNLLWKVVAAHPKLKKLQGVFWSAHQRFFKQMLMGCKVSGAACCWLRCDLAGGPLLRMHL